MDWSLLRSVEPQSRAFGSDRGRPVDRYYIGKFLEAHAADIRGRVLEFGDSTYTRRIGEDRVHRSDVLYPREGHPKATFVANLESPESLERAAYDCIICTQVLMYIYDTRTALRSMRRALKPGGVLLATFPGISQISRHDMDTFGEYWRFTSLSAARLFSEEFDSKRVHVAAFGNVLAATAFLHGLTVAELTEQELDHLDRDYEVTIAVRAVEDAPGL